MIHVTLPEQSRIIKYRINNLGVLSILTLNPKASPDKENLTVGAGFSGSVVQTEYKGVDYQSMLSSLIVDSNSSVNVNYRNPPKAVQKPNKFEVESKKLLTFK